MISAEQQPAGALRDRVRATWTAGDFGRIAVGYESTAAAFVERLGLAADEHVLDVACGTGNLAIPAARAGARVSAVDIAPALVAQLAARAALAGLDIDAREGDAEALPYADGSFDTTISMFGVMFAAHPEQAAAELVRVTRSGGRIALATWPADSFIGDMLRTTVGFVPAPAGMPSVLLWGDHETVLARLGAAAQGVRFERRTITFEYPLGPVETVGLFRNWYGPTVRAFAALDEAGQQALFDAMVELWSRHNEGDAGRTVVRTEYLEVTAVRV